MGRIDCREETHLAIKNIVELSEHKQGNWLLDLVEKRWPPRENRIDPGWFHPSSLGNPCDAYLAFQFLGTQGRPDISPRLQRVFDFGHQRDRDWKRYIGAAGVSMFEEDPPFDERPTCGRCGQQFMALRHICIPELRIRGELDDWAVAPDGSLSIVEIKTKNDRLYSQARSPDASHRVQVLPYMFAKQTWRTQIIYEDKNDQQAQEFTILWDQELWDATVARLQRILAQLSGGDSPTRTPGPYESDCDFYVPNASGFGGCSVAQFPELVDRYRERQGLG